MASYESAELVPIMVVPMTAGDHLRKLEGE